MPLPHCPHCLLPIADGKVWPFPQQPMRCPHCRLIIGPGRARQNSAEDGDARSRGSAAGVLANAARRAGAAAGGKDDVIVALRRTADTVGCTVERLRMLDYQHEAERHDDLPSLSSVLATFGTWKAARSAAAVGVGAGAPAELADGEPAGVDGAAPKTPAAPPVVRAA
jgi:hypothetical protein